MGIIGIAAGLFLGFALGAALAAAFHVSTFEGEAGYFAAAIALLVTCIVAPGLRCWGRGHVAHRLVDATGIAVDRWHTPSDRIDELVRTAAPADASEAPVFVAEWA